MSDPEWWNRRVQSHLVQLVGQLRPSRLLDKLQQVKVIELADYHHLNALRTEEERARYILYDVISKSSESTLDAFCEVLKATKGQKHLALLIQRNRSNSGDPSLTNSHTTALEEMTLSDSDQHCLLREEEPERCCCWFLPVFDPGTPENIEMRRISVPSTGTRMHTDEVQTPLLEPLRLLDPATAAEESLNETGSVVPKKVVMVIDSECSTEVESRRRILEKVCRTHWKAELDIVSIDHLCPSTPLSNSSFCCVGGKKLVSITLLDISREDFDNRKNSFLILLKGCLNLQDDEIEILEARSGSAVVVMRLSLKGALDLLCLFNEIKAELFSELHKIYPGVSRVSIHIGGLPTLSGEIVPDETVDLTDKSTAHSTDISDRSLAPEWTSKPRKSSKPTKQILYTQHEGIFSSGFSSQPIQQESEIACLYSESNQTANDVIQYLESKGIRLRKHLEPGKARSMAIVDKLKCCHKILVLLSCDYLRSNESGYAISQAVLESIVKNGKVLVIPVLLEDCEVPKELKQLIGLDLNKSVDFWERLFEALQQN